MNELSNLIPPNGTLLVWLVGAILAAGAVTLLTDLLSGLLARVPVVGPFLSRVLRIVSGQFEKWLADRVPKLADVAVQAVEENAHIASVPGQEKFSTAAAALRLTAPGLTPDEVSAQIQAAVQRLRNAQGAVHGK